MVVVFDLALLRVKRRRSETNGLVSQNNNNKHMEFSDKCLSLTLSLSLVDGSIKM